MNSVTEDFERQAVPLPITEAARHRADHFAQGQYNPGKAESVRLNTLAVWVTNDYLQMMGISTDLENSDSWNPIMRVMADVADLSLPEVGRLECRPIQGDSSVCYVPPEVWDLRVGYVVVAVAENHKTAQLLGFTPRVDSEELPLTKLEPIENLFDRLYELRQANASMPAEADPGVNPVPEAVIHLGQWLSGTFMAGWQAVEGLLSPETLTPAFGFRGMEEDISPSLDVVEASADIRRAKLVDLTVQLGHQQVILLVEMQVESLPQVQIGLQVHPGDGSSYLPPELELAVLELTGEVFMRAQARQADNYIQLQFSGELGERFKVRIQLNEAQYIEEFVI